MPEICPLDRANRMNRFHRPLGFNAMLDLAPVEETIVLTESEPAIDIFEEPVQLSKTDDPRLVTVGMQGKVTLFTSRPTKASPDFAVVAEEGYVRIDGKTVSGYVPNFGKGGKVFYAWSTGKNARLAR